MSNDDLGDRMKGYEMAEAGRKLIPFLPAMLRLDGKAFHTFTRGFARPYDERFSQSMVALTMALVKYTGAKVGYTQSDEITLALLQDDARQELFFGGRIQKLTSVVAAYASVEFNEILHAMGIKGTGGSPIFDCRVWNVPNTIEGTNVFVWRENDAVKNSIQMAARSMFSHKQCQDLSGKQLQEMLWQKGVSWNNYPSFFKRGTYVRRESTWRKLTNLELESLPPKHDAHKDPDMQVLRTDIVRMDMPPILQVVNREAVLFNNEKPITSAYYLE